MTAPFRVIVGMEVHLQLKTRTKAFCACRVVYGDEPNTHLCPVCLGLPGALPALNAEALRLGVRTGLALRCTIAARTKWDRKNYFYPDLPKGYQISQYDKPLCERGFLEIDADDGTTKRVRIRRAHLEEDTGKSFHVAGTKHSRIDLNRCGTPLLEIVSEPDLASAEEAGALPRGAAPASWRTSGRATATCRRATSAASRTSTSSTRTATARRSSR